MLFLEQFTIFKFDICLQLLLTLCFKNVFYIKAFLEHNAGLFAELQTSKYV